MKGDIAMERRTSRNNNIGMKVAILLLSVAVVTLLVNTFLSHGKDKSGYDVMKIIDGIEENIEVEVLEDEQVINVSNALEVYNSAMAYRVKDNVNEWPSYLKPNKVVVDNYDTMILMYKNQAEFDEDYQKLSEDSGTLFVEAIEVHDIKLDNTYNVSEYKGELSYAPEMMNSRAKAKWLLDNGFNKKITIAIIDTGLYSKNSDVMKYVDLSQSYDFVNGDSNVLDGIDTHATYVASSLLDIIGENLAKDNITLLNGKALENGSGTNYSLYLAICGMADRGCDIINMSCGGLYEDELVKYAIDYATDRNVIVVCSAGNYGVPEKTYPAGYDKTIAVSAIDSNKNIASFSNYGKGFIDITAPGVKIVVDGVDGTMACVDGTSFSAPIISATLAMAKMENNSIDDKAAAMAYLMSIADDLGETGCDQYFGWGLPVFKVEKEEPTIQEPITEEPTEEVTTKQPVIEEPVTKEPESEETTTRKPVVEEPTTKEPTTEEPTTEEPTTKEPTTEEPTTKEPTTEEPTTEEPTTKEPATEEPTTEKPSTGQPSKTLGKVTGLWNPGISHLPIMYGRYAWNKLEAADSYQVYRADYKANSYDDLDALDWKYVGSTTTNEFNDCTIEYEHGYFIKVRGVDKAGNYGPWSNAVEIYNYKYSLDNISAVTQGNTFKVTFDSHPKAYGYQFQIENKTTGEYDFIDFYDTSAEIRLPKGEYHIGVLIRTQRLTEKGIIDCHGGTDFFDVVIE